MSQLNLYRIACLVLSTTVIALALLSLPETKTVITKTYTKPPDNVIEEWKPINKEIKVYRGQNGRWIETK